MDSLAPRDRVLLAFEDQAWQSEDEKRNEILATFGWQPVIYYQHLVRIIATPEALAQNAMLVYRLREQFERRAQARANRALIA